MQSQQTHAAFAGLSWHFESTLEGRRDLELAGVPQTHPGRADVHVALERELATDAQIGEELRFELRPERVLLQRADFNAEIDFANERVHIDYVGHPPALQSALRAATGLLLARRGGLLLHASAVVSGERAFLFPGPSGAGKTTIARLAGQRSVLSDEIAAVFPHAGGYGTAFTPFWGDLANERRMVAGAGVAGIFFPLADDEVRIERMTPARAIARLLPCVFRCFCEENLERSLLDIAARLALAVPCALLRFRRDPRFWDEIDA